MELHAEHLTERGPDGREFLREFEECVAQAGAEARAGKPRLQTCGGAVKAIGQDAPDPIGGLVLSHHSLALLIRLGEGRRTGGLGVAQEPEHTAMDNRRQLHVVSQTTAMLLISQAIDGQHQPTPGQYGHETLWSACADETIDRHGREMTDGRTPLHTQPTVSGQQGVAGHPRVHLASAQDDVGQDGEHGCARRTLETLDGDPTEPETEVRRVARPAPAAATGRLMLALKPNRQEERHHPCEKRLAVAKQPNVSGFVLKIDSDGPVLPRSFGGCAQVSPPGHQVSSAEETRWG